MPKGLWVWPSDAQAQRAVLRKVAASSHLTGAMTAIAKSKEGLSNAELDDAINESSEWTTLWVIRQLTALGFIEFNVDFFGNPARYQLTETGRAAIGAVTGKPLPNPPAPTPGPVPAPVPAARAPQPKPA